MPLPIILPIVALFALCTEYSIGLVKEAKLVLSCTCCSVLNVEADTIDKNVFPVCPFGIDCASKYTTASGETVVVAKPPLTIPCAVGTD
jgi:hypothetical protein